MYVKNKKKKSWKLTILDIYLLEFNEITMSMYQTLIISNQKYVVLTKIT